MLMLRVKDILNPSLSLTISIIQSPIHSRLNERDPLEQRTRSRIFRYLILNHGSGFSEIKNDLDLAHGTLYYHLKILKDFGHLWEWGKGNSKRYYPIIEEDPKAKKDSNERKKDLIEIVRNKKGITQHEIKEITNLPRSTLCRNLKCLCRTGFIRETLNDEGLKSYLLFYQKEELTGKGSTGFRSIRI